MVNKIIGISGVGRSGKDSFYVYLKNLISREFGVECRRIALADALKLDLDSFLWSSLGISAFTDDNQEKDLIRDIMVAYGKVRRKMTDGRYWTDLIQPMVDNCIFHNIVPIITDIRYNVFPEDELFWLKKKNNGILFHVERIIDIHGSLVQPANSDELANDSSLRLSADFSFTWPTLFNDPKSIQRWSDACIRKGVLRILDA